MKINYQSDFDFLLALRPTADTSQAWADLLRDYDFEGCLRNGSWQRSHTFNFGKSNGEYYGCQWDEAAGHVRVICNDHGLLPGKVYCELKVNIPDSVYPDDARLTVTQFDTEIMLVSGAGDEPIGEAELTVVIPYVSPYRIAVTQGYAGTEDEYNALLAAVPEVLNAEAYRVQNESERIAAEEARQIAEAERAEAEAQRQAAMSAVLVDLAEGKQAVADAITEAGVALSAEPTLSEMAGAIRTDLVSVSQNELYARLGYDAEDTAPFVEGLKLAEELKRVWHGEHTQNNWLQGFNARKVLYVPKVDTSAVTNMNAMFQNCTALQSVPAMDTSAVTNMSNMFNGCTALQSVPAMDTSSVTNMNAMFNGCTALQSVPAMDTSAVTNMNNMFQNCTALQSVPAMDTSAVTNMSYMFYRCSSLSHIPQLDTSKSASMYLCFRECSALESVPPLDTSSSTSFDQAFSSCYSLRSVELLDMRSATNANIIFSQCGVLQYCHIKNLKISISFNNSPLLQAESVAFIINNAINTSAITITLHATAYAYAIADPDVIEALNNHPLISLASA